MKVWPGGGLGWKAVALSALLAGGWLGLRVLRPAPVHGAPPALHGAPAVAPSLKPRPGLGLGERYPYRGAEFTTLVADSYQGRRAGAEEFYRWFEAAYARGAKRIPGTGSLGLQDGLDREARRLKTLRDPAARSEEEIRVAQAVHRAVKQDIPRFSLDRGFEFANAVRYGERQCLLQSVLIAGLLQRMGIDAGTVMVWWSTRGEQSNNGHVVTLMRLPDGTDVIVDASEQEPFPRHRGLFLPCPSYRFIEPVYRPGSSRIQAYRPASGGAEIAPAAVRALPFSYVRSQFYYYRGERVPGGLLARSPSPAALQATVAYLRTSVRYAPENSLALYMLGRALLAQGKAGEADTLLESARRLYQHAGWTPEGPTEFARKARAAMR